MKYLFVVVLLLLVMTSGLAQVPDAIVVNPDMIEISFDGIVFQDASLYVSNIAILTGVVTGVHVKHTRRGEINKWEVQLAIPVETEKVTFDVDTGLIPVVERRYYIRFRFALEDVIAGRIGLSPVSDASDAVKFIGKPPKPKKVD